MTNGEENPNSESDLGPNRAGTHDPPDMLTGDQPADIDAGESEMAGGELAADPNEGSITSELAWLARGFFQPLYSLQFYRAAVQKSLIDAIVFFAVFATLLTIISTINLSRNLSSAPDDIEQAPVMGGVPSEWIPSPDNLKIPGDPGPARVALWNNGKAQVQVHEGDDDGFWVPCSSFTVTRKGLPYSVWICRRSHVKDPCDEEFMREIST